MDGNVVISVQAAIGAGTLIPIIFTAFKASKRVGRMEEKLDNACKKLDCLNCDDHNTRLSQIEGFLKGCNSVKKEQ